MPKKPQKQQRVRLRRAQVEDVVNVFKLSQRQQGAPADQDEASAAIRYFLDLIQNGHVVVADLSGRIIGAMGCEIIPGKLPATYNVTLLAIDVAYDDAGVDAALMRNLCTFVKKHDYILRVVISNTQEKKTGKLLKEDDFKVTGTIYELNAVPKSKLDEQDEDEPETEPTPPADLPNVQDAPAAPWITKDLLKDGPDGESQSTDQDPPAP